jgi:hypothetical protein
LTVPTHNFTWRQGTDLTISLVYKSGPDGEEVPVNLTNYAVRMDMKTAIGAGGIHVFTFNSEDIVETPPVDTTGATDNEATLGSEGQINIVVPRSITLSGGAVYAQMENGVLTFVYDIVLRNKTPDPDVQDVILTGTITIERSITLWA